MLDDIGIMIPSNVDPTLAPLGHASVTLLRLLPESDFANWDRKSPRLQGTQTQISPMK